MATKRSPEVIEITETTVLAVEVAVVSKTPVILNRMSMKAKQDLFLPAGRKNSASRAGSMKHDPYEEFRASAYRLHEEDAPTLLAIPGAAFKGVIRDAALDLPGATKSQIGRLVWVEGYNLPIWGVPKMFISVVRNSDVNRTPDIRTRAILPRWCTRLTIQFVTPLINEHTVLSLLATGGLTNGIGDYRPQKGHGTFGQFRITNLDDPEYLAVMAGGGRVIQEDALEDPDPFDAESAEMLSWFDREVGRRGLSRTTRSGAAA